MTKKTVAEEVLDELHRQRQMFSKEHDDQYRNMELEKAALSYAHFAAGETDFRTGVVPHRWPWNASWWKPRDRRRAMIKAAALLISAIERLDRQVKGQRSSE